MARRLIVSALLLVVVVVEVFLAEGWFQKSANAQAGCQRFEQTGHTLCGRFLQYWHEHGALAQQGYPISEPFSEMSDTDGKIYTVQYFERAVFEMHPENRPPNDVLLSLLGTFRYKQKYPNGAPRQVPNTLPGSQLFPQTGKRLGGTFLSYWQSHSGLAQQGYPISDEFLETSATDGKVYKVQYFERAVFEAHPEKLAPYDVLLSLLGTFRLREKYADGSSLPAAPEFVSGGLGLTRAEWEKLHGPGVQIEEEGGPTYEGGVYQATYAPNGLIMSIGMNFPSKMSMDEARAEGRKLVPVDARPVVLGKIPDWQDRSRPTQFVDIYYSAWLATLFPPGMLPHTQPGEVVRQCDIWECAPVGDFTVRYDIDFMGDPTKVDGLFTFVGAPDYP